jgi:hypothetical protein
MSLFVFVSLRLLNRGVKRIFLQPKCLQPISLNPALLQIGPLKGQLKDLALWARILYCKQLGCRLITLAVCHW